jgi:hypothetical protein
MPAGNCPICLESFSVSSFLLHFIVDKFYFIWHRAVSLDDVLFNTDNGFFLLVVIVDSSALLESFYTFNGSISQFQHSFNEVF